MSSSTGSERMFPVQPDANAPMREYLESSIPWWLAEEAYAQYAHHYGTNQSIERMAERKGFGRSELLDLLAGGDGSCATIRRIRESRKKR